MFRNFHRCVWRDIELSTLGIFRVEELVVLLVDGISLTRFLSSGVSQASFKSNFMFF